MGPTEDFLNLEPEKRRAVQIGLCRRALDVLNEYFAGAGEISYFESVVGTRQIVDPQLPNEAFAAVLEIGAASGIEDRYCEPLAALQDDDILFPGKIEICYYAIYQDLAQDSLYNPLWDLEGDVGRSTTTAVFSDCILTPRQSPVGFQCIA